MTVRVYRDGKMKYRYMGPDGKPYYTDQLQEDSIYSGETLLVRMDKLRELCRKYKVERYKGGNDDDLPPAA